MTKILACNCAHPSQDQLHGKNQRVANYKPKTKTWGCTVCAKGHIDKAHETKTETQAE